MNGNNIFNTIEKQQFLVHCSNAEKRSIVNELDTIEKYISIARKPCYYTGLIDERVRSIKSGPKVYEYTAMLNGVDRIDNTKGYVAGNCVPCCKAINAMKSKLSETEFYSLVKMVYEKKITEKEGG